MMPTVGRNCRKRCVTAARGSTMRGNARLCTRAALLVIDLPPAVHDWAKNSNMKTPMMRNSTKCVGPAVAAEQESEDQAVDQRVEQRLEDDPEHPEGVLLVLRLDPEPGHRVDEDPAPPDLRDIRRGVAGGRRPCAGPGAPRPRRLSSVWCPYCSGCQVRQTRGVEASLSVVDRPTRARRPPAPVREKSALVWRTPRSRASRPRGMRP